MLNSRSLLNMELDASEKLLSPMWGCRVRFSIPGIPDPGPVGVRFKVLTQGAASGPGSGPLHGAQQWVLVDAGKLVDLRYLRFGHLAREYPANGAAAGMHMEHDLGRLLRGHREEAHQHLDHEVHRGVVVVEQDHRVHRRRLQLRPGDFDRDAMAVVVVVLGIVRLVRHGSDYRRRAPGAPPRGWTAEAPGRQNARLPIVPARDPRRELPPGP